MTRFFLRTALGLLAAVALSFVLTLTFLSGQGRVQTRARAVDRLEEPAREAQRQLAAAAPGTLPETVAGLNASLAVPVDYWPPPAVALFPPLALAYASGLSTPTGDLSPPSGGCHMEGPTATLAVYAPVPRHGGVVRLGPVRERFGGPPTSHVVGLLGIVLTIVGLVAFFLSRPYVRRLRELAHTTRAIANGDLSARADVAGADAVAALARDFNHMADSLADALARQRRLIQAVSHELRTPIARLRLGVEMLTLANDDAGRREHADSVDEDLDELDRLVGELLSFLQQETALSAAERAPFRVDEALDGLVDKLRSLRPDAGLYLDGPDVDDGVRCVGNEPLFLRALGNLVSNAQRYAATRVVVRYWTEAEHVVVEVVDDGPGVPESERKAILEPFVRVDDSRSRDSGGVGLGLAITRRIVEAHGGTIEVHEADGGGARFVTRWPAE